MNQQAIVEGHWQRVPRMCKEQRCGMTLGRREQSSTSTSCTVTGCFLAHPVCYNADLDILCWEGLGDAQGSGKPYDTSSKHTHMLWRVVCIKCSLQTTRIKARRQGAAASCLRKWQQSKHSILGQYRRPSCCSCHSPLSWACQLTRQLLLLRMEPRGGGHGWQHASCGATTQRCCRSAGELQTRLRPPPTTQVELALGQSFALS